MVILMQVFKHRLNFATLTLAALAGAAASGLGACTVERPVGGAAACVPGELHCVCGAQNACEPGLSCVARRCVQLEGDAGAATTSGSQDDNPTSDTGQADEPQGSEPSLEPTESGKDPGDESDTPSVGESTGPDTSPGAESPEDKPDNTELDACEDGVRNHRETDVDCGGPICERCALGKQCRGGVDCDSEVCANGVCVLCDSHEQCDDSNDCTADRCQDHACTHIPKDQGSVCDDGDPCTAKDRCQASGACEGESTVVINEHFDNNRFRWRGMYANRENDPRGLWKLGTARASECGGSFGEDPAQDHTQNGKNGVAGVVLGGCNSRAGELRVWDCLWSKDFEVYRFDEPVIVSFWRHLHTPSSQGVVHRIVWRDTDAPNDIRNLYRGFPTEVNDSGWVLESYEIPARVRQAIGVGICYQKLPGAPSFAGWTIDDFKIRQRGCFPDG